MSGKTMLGVALLVLGILALAYQGFSYTVPKKKSISVRSQVTKEQRHNVPLPPILGALALIGGIVVLVMDRRDK